jgi:hypothetical protein
MCCGPSRWKWRPARATHAGGEGASDRQLFISPAWRSTATRPGVVSTWISGSRACQVLRAKIENFEREQASPATLSLPNYFLCRSIFVTRRVTTGSDTRSCQATTSRGSNEHATSHLPSHVSVGRPGPPQHQREPHNVQNPLHRLIVHRLHGGNWLPHVG